MPFRVAAAYSGKVNNAEMANPPNRVAELRKARGLTGIGLSQMTGLSQSQISRLEKGERKLKMDQAQAIARALRVSISDLAAEIEEAGEAPAADLLDMVPNARPDPQLPHPGDLMRGAIEDAIPVYGVASAGPDGRFIINHSDGPISRVARPPGLAHHIRVFSVLVDGSSMVPWREPGEPVFAVPGLTILKESHVLAQIDAGPGQPPDAYLKQFIKWDDDELVLRQYNPEKLFRFPREKVKEVWRVLEWREVFGV